MSERHKTKWFYALLGAALVAVLSMSASLVIKAPKELPNSAVEAIAMEPSHENVMVQIGAAQVAVDPATGDLRPLSKAEAKKLAREMRKMFKPRQVDEPTLRSDGALSAIAAPNVLRFSVARVQGDGTLAVEHADGVETAINLMTETQTTSRKREER